MIVTPMRSPEQSANRLIPDCLFLKTRFMQQHTN